MEERFLFFAGIAAVGVFCFTTLLAKANRKKLSGDERIRRGTGNAMFGLLQFNEPSVEHVIQARNAEQTEDDDDQGLGGDKEAFRSDLAEALGRAPVDPEEVRRHLTAAARTGFDWKELFAQALADELRKKPFRAPSMPPASLVAPRE